MNDVVLSSFLNLFALMGSRNGVAAEKASELVLTYLKHYYGIQNHTSYFNLYSDLRDYYDASPELDKEATINGICANLVSRVSTDEQSSVLLRLLEFCKLGKGSVDRDDSIFREIQRNFSLSDGKYSTFADFVEGKISSDVWIQPLWGGTLKTCLDRDINKLMFTYEGDTVVLMNDIPVVNGIFQTWQQSGVLKGTGSSASHTAPLYYSTVMALFENTSNSDMVEFCGRHVEYRFSNNNGAGLHDFSFNLQSGQLVAIMGGSGVGKSTLLFLLNGTIKPQSGTITVNGHGINEPEAKSLIGFVPQDDLLIEELTVYQNLWYTAKLCFDKMSDSDIDRRVNSVLTQLGLEAAKDLKVGSPINKTISGGQRKRLNIALELIREPSILFLDEPTSGLSSTDSEKVINLLKEQTYKGKLIIVNIHQPSSDIYKLFDRLWVLDKGGYPVFDGNPIEAVSYFKKEANYADSSVSACPTCGNVNPEIVLNIIDETSLDSLGNRTGNRKVTPQEWHSKYLESRPRMEEVDVSAVPPTDQKKVGKFKQMLIFLRRNFSAKITDIQYLAVTLLEAPLLALISGLLTHFTPDSGVYTLMENKNFPSFLFMAVIVSVFLGMSGSAEEIIKDRALLKREKFLSLSYGSYIWSKIIYMAGVSLVQTFLFSAIGSLVIGIHGMFWIWWLLLFVTELLSALIGLLLSQCLSSVVSIYITIPLLLIPQILLCGLVVHFEDLTPDSKTGNVPVIGDIIPSRWAYEALATASFSMNEYKDITYDLDAEAFTCQYYQHKFIYELESQLEYRQQESEDAREGSIHTAILRNGLQQLFEACRIEPYAGDWSYDSLEKYLDQAKKTLSNRGNRSTLEADARLSAMTREKGAQAMIQLKKDNCNTQLENLTVGLNIQNACKIVGDRIVPKVGQIYLKPLSKNGRAPFYSGVKVVGNLEIQTYWFDIYVLLIMCVLLSACLLSDIPGKFIRKE